jgi:leucyl-tRNA synthetase
MPVSQYTGGVEHAILHLLYSRFFTKVLYDMGLVSFTEPFPRLMNQGQVIYGGASMSKSRGNIVEPMPLVERWGADSMRLTMLFAGPFEDDIDWKLIAPDGDRRPGVNSWLGRVHAVAFEAADARADEQQELRRLAHRTVRAVTEDLERFRFNTAISKLMVLSNQMRSALDAGSGARESAELLVLMLAPFAPFLAEELWREALGHSESVHIASWPSFDPDLAREETVTLVVQVDGKVRDRVEIEADASEERCRELAMASAAAVKALSGRPVARVIVRAPRLVNLVTVGR